VKSRTRWNVRFLQDVQADGSDVPQLCLRQFQIASVDITNQSCGSFNFVHGFFLASGDDALGTRSTWFLFP
jgi:hypothetical protein